MTDFDLRKITGREPPLLTDDDRDVEIEQLRSALTEAQASAAWFRWLIADADRAASVVADAYSGWDTDTPWELALKREIDHRCFPANQSGNEK